MATWDGGVVQKSDSRISIIDKRGTPSECRVGDLRLGTFFLYNSELFLLAEQAICVQMSTGRRVAFNDNWQAMPVSVRICIEHGVPRTGCYQE